MHKVPLQRKVRAGGVGDSSLVWGRGWSVLAAAVLLALEFHQWEKSCFLQRKQGEIGGEGKRRWVAGDRARPLGTKSTF